MKNTTARISACPWPARKKWSSSMDSTPRNAIEFRVWGRFAMFTDPLTRVGGEKCSYRVPTYEALKGIAKSIYWKPTFIWIIDTVRVMRRIRTQTKGAKPLNFGGVYPSERNPTKKKEESYNTLAIYTFLTGDPDPNTGLPSVEYQVRAHFEWNDHQPELKRDQVEGKHYAIARRSLERGGRQDIFWVRATAKAMLSRASSGAVRETT